MSSCLCYLYSVYVPEKEKIEIDKKVKKSQNEFRRGFLKGSKLSIISLSIYSISLLVPAAAHAVGSKTPSTFDTEVIKPTKPSRLVPDLSEKEFLAEVGAFVLQNEDFYLGLSCSMLLILSGIIIYPPSD